MHLKLKRYMVILFKDKINNRPQECSKNYYNVMEILLLEF